MNNKLKTLLLFTITVLNILASIHIFSNGFLIRRTALNTTNLVKPEPRVKRAERAIILFIDALRFDFIFTDNKYFGLSTLERLLEHQPAQSRLFKFIADPPTTTMQRIKAMMSGTLPTFIDAGANFNSYLIDDDNLINQCHLNNKSVVILGDDTWLSLFPAELIDSHTTFPSFNIKDLDTNDLEVDKELKRLLKKPYAHNWGLIIGHYLGLDHCGHTFGPKNPNIKRKLTDIDNTLRFVIDSIDEDTLLIVMGDHGMTEVGDHGGDSRLEVESALFFYSKKQLFKSKQASSGHDEVRQIDLTPTLALALGVPIPFSNLGAVILEFFDDAWSKASATRSNLVQLRQFVNKYKTYETLFEEIRLLDEANIVDADETSTLKVHADLKVVQEKFREKWSTFNTNYCLLGIFLLFLALFNACALTFQLINQSNRQYNRIFDDLTFFMVKKATIYSAIYLSLTISLASDRSTFSWLCLLIFNMDLLYSNRELVLSSDLFSKLVQLIYNKFHLLFILTLLIPFSNSFIITENTSLRFFLISMLYMQMQNQLTYTKQASWRIWLPFTCILFIRLSFVFHICREEVMQKCTQYMFTTQLQKASIDKVSYIFFIAFNFVLIYFIMDRVRPRRNSRVLNFVYVIQFLALVAYNLIELEINSMESLIIESKLSTLNTSSTSQAYLFNLKLVNIFLARLVFLLFLVNLVTIYVKYSNVSTNSKRDNLVISHGLLSSLILGESRLSIWILIFVLDSFFKRVKQNSNDIEENSDDRSSHILFLFLIQHYYFYATGHETTFTNIKWESAFHGMYGDTSTVISHVIMGALIVLNTYCSTVIVCIYVVFFDQISAFKSAFKFTILSAIKIFSSVLSVYLLRRHLMVWKIFAPRFVFDFLDLVVVFTSLLVFLCLN